MSSNMSKIILFRVFHLSKFVFMVLNNAFYIILPCVYRTIVLTVYQEKIGLNFLSTKCSFSVFFWWPILSTVVKRDQNKLCGIFSACRCTNYLIPIDNLRFHCHFAIICSAGECFDRNCVKLKPLSTPLPQL